MKLQTKTTTEFFNTEYVNFASYDNIRKIPSLVDGQKNSSRKILWYTLQKNLKNEVKVSQLDSKVAEETEYLHGTMAGVIVNLGQNYVGTNNINLMMPEGNFGTRLIPEASAPRYIYTYGSPEFFDIFSKEDNEILEHQEFEGHQIEPKFMLPKLPMLLINGAEGISSGFSSKILPRDPKAIEKYIKYYLKKPDAVRKPFQNKPFFRGFTGTVEQGEEKHKWEIEGAYTRKANKVYITELPVGYSLKSYLKILDKLEEDKIIITYKDNTTTDFNFEVQFNRKYLDSLSDEKLVNLLKLRKKSSELYVVMSQNNTVEVFDSIGGILNEYMDVKLQYLEKRKTYKIGAISQEIKVLISKYVFIQNLINNTLVITKRPMIDITTDLDKLDKIIKVDDNYDYLLNMAVRSLTEERMSKLLQQIKDRKVDLDFVKQATVQEMWLKDLN